MNIETITIILFFTGIFGSLITVLTNNHVSMSFGYLTLISSLSGLFMILGNFHAALTLIILQSVSIVTMLIYGISSCDFNILIKDKRKRFVTFIALISSASVFMMLTMIFLKTGFNTISVPNYQSFGELLLSRYAVLFEIVSAVVFTSVAGTVFMVKRRN